MALSAPVERYAQNRTLQLGTTTLSPTGTVVVGQLLLLFAGTGGSTKVISSVSDDAGNTWVVDKTANDGTRGASVARCQVTAQLTSSSVITVTWSDATSRSCQMWLQEVGGASTSGALDQSVSATGTGTAASSGATGALSQTAEIVFGFFKWQANTTWAKGASYTDVTTPTLNSACGLAYKIVAATDAVTADGTIGVSTNYIAIAVTYTEALASASMSPSVSASISKSPSASASPSSSVSKSPSASASPSSSVSSSPSLSGSPSASISKSPSASASPSSSVSLSMSSSPSPSPCPTPINLLAASITGPARVGTQVCVDVGIWV